MRPLISVLLLIISFSTCAADKSGNFAVWGVGKKSCFNYNKSKETGDYDAYKNFVMGYLTAVNYLTPDTYNFSGGMQITEIMEWLDDYCELKGINSFELALSDFLDAHKDKRYTSPPVVFGR